MDNSSPLVLEISSDEDSGFGDSRKGSFEIADGEDCEWLSKLLCEVGENIDDDSDDVVFVSEVFPNPRKKSRSESLKPSPKIVDVKGDDDDCVVLDGDPDKPVVVVNSKVVDDDSDSDDLEIISEKGEVACRDFPHPRHLCAKFLFASTPHEVHCGQCHCYVCDSVAPCSQWGTGTASIDHCHASDKEEYWRTERKHVKKAAKPVPEISTTTTTNGTYRIDSFFPATQVPVLTPPQPNSLAENRGFSPVAVHSRPISSNVIVPNSNNHIRTHPSGYAVPRYKPPSQLASVQSHPSSNRNAGSGTYSRNLQSFPPREVFKRHGFVRASPYNRHEYGSLKRCRVPQAPVINGQHNSNVGSHTAGAVLPPPRLPSHTMNVRCPNYLPSRSQIQSQPYLHCLNQDPRQNQSQPLAQPYVNGNLPSAAPLQSNIATVPSVRSINNLVIPGPHIFQPANPAPPQAVASCEADAGNAFRNQLHPRSMIPSQPDVGNNLENLPSQPQAHYNPSSLLMQGNQTQNGIDVSPTDFSFFLDSSLNNGNLQIHAEESQYQSRAPAETSQSQNVQKTDQLDVDSVDKFPHQSVVLAEYTSPINDGDCQFPQSTGPGPFDFHFDNWMFENQPLSGALEDSLSPTWNVFSPEPSFIDTGILFDI